MGMPMAFVSPSTLQLLPAGYRPMTAEEERAAIEAVASLLRVLLGRHRGVVDVVGGSRSHASSPRGRTDGGKGGDDDPHGTDRRKSEG